MYNISSIEETHSSKSDQTSPFHTPIPIHFSSIPKKKNIKSVSLTEDPR